MFKKSILVLTFICCYTSYGQQKVIDSLIQHINNKEAYLLLIKTLSPRIDSKAGKQIIQIGKNASPELIQILDTSDKGIIAHFILSEIWKETWDEQICCNIMNNDNFEVFKVNGLKIQIENNILKSEEIDLKLNKVLWKKRITT